MILTCEVVCPGEVEVDCPAEEAEGDGEEGGGHNAPVLHSHIEEWWVGRTLNSGWSGGN